MPDWLCHGHAARGSFSRLIPTSLEYAQPVAITGVVLAGMVLFFILEKLVLWRHCHEGGECEVHGQAASLILVGDAFHNCVDGMVIAVAFLNSVPLGVTAALAVIAHEVPQEVGDFAILLDGGYGRAKALVLNTLSASATLPGALATYFRIEEARGVTPYILAISAASFIYIATADLIPSLHRHVTFLASARQLALLLAGIGTIAWLCFGH